MKKFYLSVALVLTICGSLTLSSCIGSFALTNRVLAWNKQVGNKFLNEVVFFCFWILPVYEVTSIADVLIINSIEFWSGRNPLQASVKTVKTENGTYTIACDGKGYTITNDWTGEDVRLDFIEAEQTWAVNHDGELMPFLTYVDDNHVKAITPEGDMRMVELSETGLMAYRAEAGMALMAMK